MNEKPEALRLADNLYAEYRGFSCIEIDAAAELRRQHAKIERMRKALHGVDEFCQQGLNSADPVHWEAALQDIMGLVRAALRQEV